MPVVCHSYVLVYHPYVIRVYSYVIVHHSYVLVCHPYVTRMYSYVIRVSLVCTRVSSVCTRVSPVCHSYVLVCHRYVTRMWFYHEPLKKVSYLAWQNKYSDLKTTCHIKPKLFLWTKLLEILLLSKFLISVAAILNLKLLFRKTFPHTLPMKIRCNVKDTLMQIWKSCNTFVFI